MTTSSFFIMPPGSQPGSGARSQGHGNPAAAPSPYDDHARAEADYLRRHLENIAEEPLLTATIVEVRGRRMQISLGPGNALDVHAIEGATVGRRVRCNRNSMQAIDLLPEETPTGTIITAARDAKAGGIVEGDYLGTLRGFKTARDVAKGERLVVDSAMMFVIGSLGMPPAAYALAQATSTTWEDIGGQDEAKAALREAIELPFAHPELFAAYGKRVPRGVLLAGPAGCGKTMIGKAAATAIARASGDALAKGGFIYVKGPELLGSFIGKSEEAIRRLFAAARDYKKDAGRPAIVFLDECDALLGSRDVGTHNTLNATIVPQFLSEMDGLDDAAAMVILATNKPDRLDPAVVRDGRIDRKVRLMRPGKADAAQIAKIHLASRPLTGQSIDEASSRLAEGMFADRVVRAYEPIGALHLRHFISGAMIAGIVEAAATRAMLRDLETPTRKAKAKAGGIRPADLEAAIEGAARQCEHISHAEALAEVQAQAA